MTRHPTHPDLWAYTARSDDLVVLSRGNKFDMSDIEKIIMTHPGIRVAIREIETFLDCGACDELNLLHCSARP